jgi:hypothetical protein
MYSNLVTKKSGQGVSLTEGKPVTVPSDFFGLCFVLGPNGSGRQGTVNHVGILNIKSVRMSQQDGARWNQIETSDGVFDWAKMDAAITFARQNGMTVYWGVYGTPRFYADNTVLRPTVTDFNATDPWGSHGGAAMPTDLSKQDRFVRAVITRYNSPTGAWRLANPTLGKGIQYVETGNEPVAVGTGNGATFINGPGVGFSWYTPAQNVDRCWTIINAIKAVDNEVLISTDGFDDITSALNFLNATGPISGIQGKNLPFDEFAWHPYRQMPVGYPRYSANNAVIYDQYIDNGVKGIKTLKNALASVGVNWPIVISEVGYDSDSTNSNMIAWMAEPAQFKYLWLMHVMLACAALGVKRYYPWNWEISPPIHSLSTSGFWQTDKDGVTRAGNNIANFVCGKTIVDDSFSSPKSAYLKFSDGSKVELSLTKDDLPTYTLGLASKLLVNFNVADWYLGFDDHDYFKNYFINSHEMDVLSGTITPDANGYPTGTGVARIVCVPSLMKTGTWHIIWTGTIGSVAVSSAVSGAITTTVAAANRVTFTLGSPLGLTLNANERLRVDLTNPSGLTGLFLVHNDEFVENTYTTLPLKTAIANAIAPIKILRFMDANRTLNAGYQLGVYASTGDSYTVTTDGLNLTLVGSSSDQNNLANAISSRGGIANCNIVVIQFNSTYLEAYRTFATGWNAGTKTFTLAQPIRTGLTTPDGATNPLTIQIVEKRTVANRTKNKDILQIASVPKRSASLAAVGDGCWHQGYSIELMAAICNQINADMWFNVAQGMSDADIQGTMTIINNNLNPALNRYMELSNEVWNFDLGDKFTWNYGSARTRQINGTGQGAEGSGLGHATDFVAMSNAISTWLQTNMPGDVGRQNLKANRTGLGKFIRVFAWQQGSLGLAETIVSSERAGARADVFSTAPYIQAGIQHWSGATTPLLANLSNAPFNTYPDYRRVLVDGDTTLNNGVYYRLGGTFVKWARTDAATNAQILADLRLATDYMVSANAWDEGYLLDDFTYSAGFRNQANALIRMPMYQYEGGADFASYRDSLGISEARWDTFRESPQYVEFLTYYIQAIKNMHIAQGTPDYVAAFYLLGYVGWGIYADTSKMVTSNQVSQFLNTNLVKV